MRRFEKKGEHGADLNQGSAGGSHLPLLWPLMALGSPSSWGWQRRAYKALLVAQESEPNADATLALLAAAAFSVPDIRLTASQVHYIELSLPCGVIIPR